MNDKQGDSHREGDARGRGVLNRGTGGRRLRTGYGGRSGRQAARMRRGLLAGHFVRRLYLLVKIKGIIYMHMCRVFVCGCWGLLGTAHVCSQHAHSPAVREHMRDVSVESAIRSDGPGSGVPFCAETSPARAPDMMLGAVVVWRTVLAGGSIGGTSKTEVVVGEGMHAVHIGDCFWAQADSLRDRLNTAGLRTKTRRE